jgi:hypothetical protein
MSPLSLPGSLPAPSRMSRMSIAACLPSVMTDRRCRRPGSPFGRDISGESAQSPLRLRRSLAFACALPAPPQSTADGKSQVPGGGKPWPRKLPEPGDGEHPLPGSCDASDRCRCWVAGRLWNREELSRPSRYTSVCSAESARLLSSNWTGRPVFCCTTVALARTRPPLTRSPIRTMTTAQPRSLLSMARSNRARSPSRPSRSSRKRIAQTCCGFSACCGAGLTRFLSTRLWRGEQKQWLRRWLHGCRPRIVPYEDATIARLPR